MNNVENKMVVGATWMVSLKFIERGIGFVSTLILARLLMPEDFGLVAMAMAVYAFIEIGGQFGFDFALIREQNATRRLYDSAWTLSVGYGIFSACALAVLAPIASAFFTEPRLEAVIYALAVVSLVAGFENIGIVNFRKEFLFKKDFQFIFLKKIISFFVTVSLAIVFRSYWALVAGILVSRMSGVILSYVLHPFRPKIDFSKIRELFNFSKWILLSRVTGFFGDRGPHFLIGRFLDPAFLGIYSVGREISTLPTTELIYPIMRAVFPGYAAIAHDRQQLARSFLNVQGMLVTIAFPAGIGIVMVADPFVRFLLGPNWLEAVPVIQVLGIYGAITVFQATNNSVFNSLGVPVWGTVLKLLEIVILLPAMFIVLRLGYGVQGVVWSILGAQLLVIPAGIFLISRMLNIGFLDRLRVAWRPVIASLVMSGVLYAFAKSPFLHGSGAGLSLAICVPAGVVVFSSSLLFFWLLAGKPQGPEATILEQIQKSSFGRVRL